MDRTGKCSYALMQKTCGPVISSRRLPLLPSTFCVLPHRVAVAKGHPCECDALADRCVSSAYRCENLRPMGKAPNISLTTTIANSDRVSPEWQRRAPLSSSTHPITPRKRMRSVNAFSQVCGASVSTICSSSMRGNSSECWVLTSSTSIGLDPIEGSSSRFQNRVMDLCHQITMVARSSPSQSWVDYTMLTAEVHEPSHEEAGA
jgi:hypothetical protein